MRAVDVIRKKRDGRVLSRADIQFFVTGITAGTLPDYQASALLMAILLRGMNAEETEGLTDAMVHSGVRVDLSDVPGIKVDKHSTGGVGDKTSLVLAPLAAACGVSIPMMSGRGLGHTGGTLDKLESIPGFRVNLSLHEMKAALARVGCVMIGQTAEVAPADKKLYALRDVTGDRREHSPDQRLDHEQEDRRRDRRARPRREDRQRRVHEDGSRFAAPGRVAGVARQRLRRDDGSDHHQDGRAARPRGGKRARSDRVHRGAERRRSGGCRGFVGGARGAHARARAGGRRSGRRRTADPRGDRVGSGPRAVPAHHRAAGRRSARGGRLRPAADRARTPPGGGAARRISDLARCRAGRPRFGRAWRRARPHRPAGRRRGRYHGAQETGRRAAGGRSGAGSLLSRSIATRGRDGAGASSHPDRRPTTGAAAADCGRWYGDGRACRRALDRSGAAVRQERPDDRRGRRSPSPSSPPSPRGWG